MSLSLWVGVSADCVWLNFAGVQLSAIKLPWGCRRKQRELRWWRSVVVGIFELFVLKLWVVFVTR